MEGNGCFIIVVDACMKSRFLLI